MTIFVNPYYWRSKVSFFIFLNLVYSLILCPFWSHAVVQTDLNYTPKQLVEDVFLAEGCFDIDPSSIQFTGAGAALGYFEGGEAAIGMVEGIILSTGSIKNAEGPNDTTAITTAFGDDTGDVDIELLASTSLVLDAAVLEFDFTPSSNRVEFSYVFASEEYCEYIGSGYNDVFGFFISGPGIDGPFENKAENIAFVPNTNDYVSINNINHLNNNEYYIPNMLIDNLVEELVDPESNCYNHPNALALQEIEYDGFTKALKAIANVEPCQTYHIKIVVADIIDEHLDSAVLLAANSFTAGAKVKLSAYAPSTQNPSAYEGCSDGHFLFDRGSDDTSEDITLKVRIEPSSTAVEGVDFEAFNKDIVIPAGDRTLYLPIKIFEDNAEEGVETLNIAFEVVCGCEEPATIRASLDILEGQPFVVAPQSYFICEGDSVDIQANVTGGIPDYKYRWENSLTSSSLKIAPTKSTLYNVTITDGCGRQDTTYVQVDVVSNTTPYEVDTLICENSSLFIFGTELKAGQSKEVSLQSVGGCDSLVKLNVIGIPDYQMTVEKYVCEDQTFLFENEEMLPNTTKELVYTSQSGCDSLVQLKIVSVPNYSIEIDTFICAENSLSFQNKNLKIGDTESFNFQNIAGCDSTVTLQVFSKTISLSLAAIDVSCFKAKNGSIDIQIEGGREPYQFSTDGEDYNTNFKINNLGAGLYVVYAKDADDCEAQEEVIIKDALPWRVDAGEDILIRLGRQTQLQAISNRDDKFTYLWEPAASLSCATCASPIASPIDSTLYYVTATDENGCSSTDSTLVAINFSPDPAVIAPAAFSPNGDGLHDHFQVQYQGGPLASFQLTIFNRWGQKVYDSTDPYQSWDGYFQEKSVDLGIYIYYTNIVFDDGFQLRKEGTVMVMR